MTTKRLWDYEHPFYCEESNSREGLHSEYDS